MKTSLFLVASSAALVSACGGESHERWAAKRQVAAGTTLPANGLIQSTPASQPGGATIPALTELTANAPTQTTQALFSTVAAGAAGPFPSAPAIPSFTFTAGTYPPLDTLPDVNSPEVKQWLSEIDLSGVPNLSITNGSCDSNPAESRNASARGWWTCGGYTRSTDITTCPDKFTFGLSYDDGPSPYTPLLLDYLNVAKLKATFFVVGSRVISRPEMLQLEHASGHEISVHTWSHPPLTTLTNEQIVAELGWTKKAIKDVIGVTPKTMRPPYGDIDDRVRAICKLMGLTPVIWTGLPDGSNFDTDDWRIAGGGATGVSSVAAFDKIMADASTINTGFIVLEHDLYQQSVDLAVGYILPSVLNSTNPKFNLKSVIECQNQPLSAAYVETSGNSNPIVLGSSSPSSATSAPSASASGSSGIRTAGLSGSALASASSKIAAVSASAASAAKSATSGAIATSGSMMGVGAVGASVLCIFAAYIL